MIINPQINWPLIIGILVVILGLAAFFTWKALKPKVFSPTTLSFVLGTTYGSVNIDDVQWKIFRKSIKSYVKDELETEYTILERVDVLEKKYEDISFYLVREKDKEIYPYKIIAYGKEILSIHSVSTMACIVVFSKESDKKSPPFKVS